MSSEPESSLANDERLNEAIAAYLRAIEAGETPNRQALIARSPDLAAELQDFFAGQDQVDCLVAPLRSAIQAAFVTPVPDETPRDGAPRNGHAFESPGRSFGDYELLEEIGRGGMGVVYRARQKSLNRQVALKMVRIQDLSSAAEAQRFRNEAETVGALHHAHIVPIYEVGEREGYLYYSMRLIEGGSLDKHLGEYASQPRAAAQLVATVGRAVHHAHQRGVLHRDLKPGNILMEKDAIGRMEDEKHEPDSSFIAHPSSFRPYVTDFGLAKRVESDSALTQSGALVGTPSYMAPEQTTGKKGAVTTATDVYGLGALLYALLTGRPPFRGDTVIDTLTLVRESEPESPGRINGNVSRDLEAICLTGLQKNPMRRYASAAALADDLECWLSGEPVRARSISWSERLLRWSWRNRAVAASLMAVSAALLVGTVVSAWFAVEADRRAGLESNARQDADRNAKAEKTARAEEKKARDEAEERTREITRTLAVSTLRLAQSAWRENDAGRAKQLLRDVPPELRKWEWHYLNRHYQGGYLTLRGHTQRVSGVAFDPDGKRIATASADSTAKIWDANTGQELLTLKGHTSQVSFVVFSPDGKRLATTSWDGTARIWDAQTGKELRAFNAHTKFNGASSPDGSVAFSPDGQRFATGGEDGKAKIWDSRTGEQLLTVRHLFEPRASDSMSVVFSPDGQRLATKYASQPVQIWDAHSGKQLLSLQGNSGRAVFSPDGQRLATVDGKVWDARTGQEIMACKAHNARIENVAFSPDGLRLATGVTVNTAKVWDARTGQELLTLNGHTGSVLGIAFSPDGQRIATASNDGTAMVWDARADQGPLTIRGHSNWVRGVAFSPDGKRLATAGSDQTAKVWSTRTGIELFTFKGHMESVQCVAFSPDGQRIATASSDQTAKIWDAKTGRTIFTLQGHKEGIHCVAFSPDGALLATGSYDRTAKVWNANSGRELFSLRGDSVGSIKLAFSNDGKRLAMAGGKKVQVCDPKTGQELIAFKGSQHYGSVTFSPDSQRLAAAEGKTVKVWDVHTGQEILILRGHSTLDLAFSPDGERIVTASAFPENATIIWDARTGQELVTIKGPFDRVESVAFSPNGNFLATAYGSQVGLWSTRAVPEPLILAGQNTSFSTVAFSLDGKRVAAGRSDCLAKVWDARSGLEQLTLEGHTQDVTDIDFSLDGQRIATASADQTAKVWDAKTGKEVLTLRGHAGRLYSVVFSPDGLRLATASSDSTAKVWDALTGEILFDFKGNYRTPSYVAFSPDGKRLSLTERNHGQALLWDLERGNTIANVGEAVTWTRDAVRSPDGRYLAGNGDRDGLSIFDLKESADSDEMEFRLAMARLDPIWQSEQAAHAIQAGQWFAVAFHLDRVLSARPLEGYEQHHRGWARAELGRWADAQADFAGVTKRAPNDPIGWQGLALTQLAMNQPDDYGRTCAEMERRFAQPLDPKSADLLFCPTPGSLPPIAILFQTGLSLLLPRIEARQLTLRICLARPGALAEPNRLLALAPPADGVLRGAVMCRAGRSDEAVRILTGRSGAMASFYLALAEHGRGRDEAAKQALQAAQQSLAAQSTSEPNHTNYSRLSWTFRMEVDLLRREVEALLGAKK